MRYLLSPYSHDEPRNGVVCSESQTESVPGCETVMGIAFRLFFSIYCSPQNVQVHMSMSTPAVKCPTPPKSVMEQTVKLEVIRSALPQTATYMYLLRGP